MESNRLKNLVKQNYGHAKYNSAALECAINDLWRNYPEWPSTFGPCYNPECDGSGRGSGLCRTCITDCIAEITGNKEAALALQLSIESVRAATHTLRSLVDSAKPPAPTLP